MTARDAGIDRGDAGESIDCEGNDATVHGDGDVQRREHAEFDEHGDVEFDGAIGGDDERGGIGDERGNGTTTIWRDIGNGGGITTLTVTAAALVSIAVTPANPSIAKGTTEQFTATGTYRTAARRI